MRTFLTLRYRIFSLCLAIVLLTTACKQASSQNGEAGLAPTVRDKSISTNFCRLLEARHVSHKKLDQESSQRAFNLFLKSIDPMKIYFTKDDVRQFELLYKDKFVECAQKGDLPPAFAIYRRFIQRAGERADLAREILQQPLDFTVDEYYIRDKDLLDYPGTPDEIRDRWTKRIKFEILSLEVDNRNKTAKTTNTNNEKVPMDATVAEPAVVASANRADDSPIAKLVRRYSGLEKRIAQTTNDDVLELFLTAIANSYDPHSTYMSPKTFENFSIQMRLNLDGIGATLGWEDGYTTVKSIVPGGAADKQKELTVEDKIIGVAQGTGQFEDVVDMNLSDVVAKIRGKRGSVVRLEVIPATGGSVKEITIVREKIELEDSAAKSEVFEIGQKSDGSPYKIGVIDLPSFYFDMEARGRGDTTGRSTTRDVKKILGDFVAQNVDACVVDLRTNGGGSLQEVVDLTGLFIETGSVVQVRPSEFGNMAKSLDDRDPGVDWTGPLVVVTSKFSASASEIFAGAIKDYKRGIIVGDDTTHGKGTVQPLIEIGELLFGPLTNAPNYGTLKVTIQGFYLPDGESTQLTGVTSDLVLPSITNYFEGTEADSDYPLSFDKIAPAKDYPIFNYVSSEIITALNQKSAQRIDTNIEWTKIKNKIANYREFKATKRDSLMRDKFYAQRDRLNADDEEKAEYERLMGLDQKIRRDYYMNELLNITVDYLDLLRYNRIQFPKELKLAKQSIR